MIRILLDTGLCCERARGDSTSRDRSSSIMNEFVWKKHEYIREHSHRPVDTRRVMVIYSGGTLGMMYKEGQGQRDSVTD